MRSLQPQKGLPGWFNRNNQRFLALSQVPQVLNLSASEISDAVSRGEIQVERISGCKAVAVDELFSFIAKREGK